MTYRYRLEKMSWRYTSLTSVSLDFNGTQSYEFVVQAINSNQLHSKSRSISGTAKPIVAIGKVTADLQTQNTLLFV